MSIGIRATIEDFLSYRRLAVAGVSRHPDDFSRKLYRELRSRGYELVPVNPHAEEVDGDRCYARITDIQPPVDGALLMTSGKDSRAVVEDCAAAGVKRVWLYRGAGQGAATPEAVEFCRKKEIAVVPGECPFMFLAGVGWMHGVHGFCRKLVGTYPQ